MLRLLIARGPLRLVKGFPVLRVHLAVEIAGMAWAHLAKLSGAQRRRVLVLLVKTRARPSRLSEHERQELTEIASAFEPRLLAGSVAKRLSPVPVPKRVLYGPRGSVARGAAAQRH